ncbi:hypothetical protein B0H13DRAFT_1879424 [Mycena leptocephala]|nr:hypothetical protein B0H13DRAFT_1879424 [Mycena leptocephala]
MFETHTGSWSNPDASLGHYYSGPPSSGMVISPTHLAPPLHPRFRVILIGMTSFQESTSAFAPPLASDLEQHENWAVYGWRLMIEPSSSKYGRNCDTSLPFSPDARLYSRGSMYAVQSSGSTLTWKARRCSFADAFLPTIDRDELHGVVNDAGTLLLFVLRLCYTHISRQSASQRNASHNHATESAVAFLRATIIEDNAQFTNSALISPALPGLLALTQQLTPSKSPRTGRRVLNEFDSAESERQGQLRDILAVLPDDVKLKLIGHKPATIKSQAFYNRFEVPLLYDKWDGIIDVNTLSWGKRSHVQRRTTVIDTASDDEELDDIFSQARSAVERTAPQMHVTSPPHDNHKDDWQSWTSSPSPLPPPRHFSASSPQLPSSSQPDGQLNHQAHRAPPPEHRLFLPLPRL